MCVTHLILSTINYYCEPGHPMAWQTRHSTYLEQSQREVLQDEEGFQSLALYEASKDYWMGRHRRHGSGDLVHSLCWKVSKNCRQACRERDINTNKKSSQMTTSKWYKRPSKTTSNHHQRTHGRRDIRTENVHTCTKLSKENKKETSVNIRETATNIQSIFKKSAKKCKMSTTKFKQSQTYTCFIKYTCQAAHT